MPLREESNWTVRYKDDIEVEPFKKYYLIFEGSRTEISYFRGLVNYSKELGISNDIEVIILNKVGEIEHHSTPEQIYGFLLEKRKEIKKLGDYVPGVDKFVMVFDRDSYKEYPEKYLEFISNIDEDIILAVTSPCFELWLILHKEGAIEKFIEPRYKEILANPKESNQHTIMSKIFSEEYGLNPKKKMNFCVFLSDVNTAIMNEKLLEQDYTKMDSNIGSNIGMLIEKLREDPRKWIQ